MDPFTHDAYKESYIEHEEFKEVFQYLQGHVRIEEGDEKDDYHFQNGVLYKIDKICVPKGEWLQLIKKIHTFKFARHFGVGKKISNL